MSNLTISNINVVRSIGRGVRFTEEAVTSIVASLPDDFDPKQRGAVAEAVHVWACGDNERPALKTGARGQQVTTDYGRGHDTLVTAVKRALNQASDSGSGSTDKYVTAAGLKAADWDTFVRKAYAEWTAANENKDNQSVTPVAA